MPLEGLIILKRLNTKEDEEGVRIEDTEYVYAAGDYRDIIRNLCKYPKNRLSWLIVAKFARNEEGELEYSDGTSALNFLAQAQNYLAEAPRSILLN